MANTLEKDIERKLREMVKRHGGLCLKWVCPGRAGVPDRIILLPGGRVIFAEVKRPKGGRYSGLQLWWAEKIRALGFPWFGVKDQGGIALVEDYIMDTKRSF